MAESKGTPKTAKGHLAMFESAEIGASLTDRQFAHIKDGLRLRLIELQQKLRGCDAPVLVVLCGVRGAGVVDTVNLLNTWMDPRWIATNTFDEPTDEERERPRFWRFWRALPAAGTIGLYPGGWYEEPIANYCAEKCSRAAFSEYLQEIRRFEQTHAAEGALVLKFWLHLSKNEHARLTAKRRKDPLVGLRPSDTTWSTPEPYDSYVPAAASAISATNTVEAPWLIVEGGDDNFRRATVLTMFSDRLAHHLKHRKKVLKARRKTLASERKRGEKQRRKRKNNGTRLLKSAFAKLNMRACLTDAAYKKAFHREQFRLHELQGRCRVAGISTIVVMEGWDAAGKGGAIRRMSFALNARDYRIVPIAAPTDEERAHHFLWRFWRHLGRTGRVTIFDRSWYGRVLVERVEHLIEESAWRRAYDEINDFENQLTARRGIVVKIWLHISKEEQLARFKQRAKLAFKRWKLTDEDWRNRERWNDYEDAAQEAFDRTSSKSAPWTLIPANNKHYARINVMRTVSDAMQRALRAADGKRQETRR